MDASIENKNKYVALAFTVGFHALLFLLFLFIVFITPLPPFEVKIIPEVTMDLGTEGFGNSDAGGSGQHNKDIATSEKAVKNPVVDNSAPNILTDDSELAAVVKTNPKNKKN